MVDAIGEILGDVYLVHAAVSVGRPCRTVGDDLTVDVETVGVRFVWISAYNSEPVIKELNIMQAIIVTGGKQYKVSEGDVLFIEKLEAEAGEILLRSICKTLILRIV